MINGKGSAYLPAKLFLKFSHKPDMDLPESLP